MLLRSILSKFWVLLRGWNVCSQIEKNVKAHSWILLSLSPYINQPFVIPVSCRLINTSHNYGFIVELVKWGVLISSLPLFCFFGRPYNRLWPHCNPVTQPAPPCGARAPTQHSRDQKPEAPESNSHSPLSLSLPLYSQAGGKPGADMITSEFPVLQWVWGGCVGGWDRVPPWPISSSCSGVNI